MSRGMRVLIAREARKRIRMKDGFRRIRKGECGKVVGDWTGTN
jgi:hypothetical protein